MKPRAAVFLVCALAFAFLAYKFLGISSVLTSPTPLPVPTTAPTHTDATLTYQDIVYDYEFFTADFLNHLKLIPNFEAPMSGKTIAETYHCRFAVNGGFYSTDKKPLGAFISDAYRQPNALTSRLFNGFVMFTDTKAAIAEKADTAYTSLLQSGPLLLTNGSPLPLAIQNDEHARRSVVAITNGGQLMFLTFYIHDSIYNGPLLGDLPMILKEFAETQHISIQTALNLDGGSATYFKTTDMELPELTPIGSLFCLTK